MWSQSDILRRASESGSRQDSETESGESHPDIQNTETTDSPGDMCELDCQDEQEYQHN